MLVPHGGEGILRLFDLVQIEDFDCEEHAVGFSSWELSLVESVYWICWLTRLWIHVRYHEVVYWTLACQLSLCVNMERLTLEVNFWHVSTALRERVMSLILRPLDFDWLLQATLTLKQHICFSNLPPHMTSQVHWMTSLGSLKKHSSSCDLKYTSELAGEGLAQYCSCSSSATFVSKAIDFEQRKGLSVQQTSPFVSLQLKY